jgi:septal ring factor EnvC (AmiA/AmiB activator)
MIKEDPYASMEKDQLISMIHFLVKREDETTNEVRVEPNPFGLYLTRRRKIIIQRAQEVQELKDMIRELKDTHKEDVKTRQSLLKAIDDLTRRLADSDAENKELRQEIKNLLSRISVSNKVRFGSTSQKGTKKKAAPVQDREKDKDGCIT